MVSNDDTEQTLRASLHGETAKIHWCELQRFFAAGSTIGVAPELDLLEVAYQICRDNKAQVAEWMEAGKVASVSDDQARQWLEDDAVVWSVVVKPWVLVQPEH